MDNKIQLHDWQNIVTDALDETKKQGASAAEISASMATGFSAAVRMGNVDTVEFTRDKSAIVTVYFGQQKGSASTTDMSAAAMLATVKAACDIARVTGRDPYAGLADKALMATHVPDLDLYHPWDITPEQAITLATECETLARNYDARITNSEGATVNTHRSHYVYANTHGFVGNYATTRHSLSCALIGQANDQMQRDYSYTAARAVEDLKSAKTVAAEAAEKTLRRLGAKKLSTRQAPVIFEADVARGLLGSFIGAIRGSNLYRNASFLVDCLGQQIFPAHIQIFEQPHLPKRLGSAPFDGEGIATSAKHFIRDGMLENYVLSSYSARKLGMAPTGNAGGVFNLFINTSDHTLPALLKEMGTGLLVTELMGQGVNLLNGDYSRGASGFWVENGEIAYPVEEITIAGNLRDMFMNLVAVASDVQHASNIITGSILIEQMMIAGN